VSDHEFFYECDMKGGFVMNPKEHRRVGYVTQLIGMGLTDPGQGLAADLRVAVPYNNPSAPRYRGITIDGATYSPLANRSGMPVAMTTVLGVIKEFRWNGGVCDPIELEIYVSQENALKVKNLMAKTLTNTKINSLIWWIAEFDQETKQWFEQSFPTPITGITGQVNVKGEKERLAALKVDMTPVPVIENIDVNVYKIEIEVVPMGDKMFALSFAASVPAPQKVVRPWGLTLGSSS
jgi:hypothetical protein